MTENYRAIVLSSPVAKMALKYFSGNVLTVRPQIICNTGLNVNVTSDCSYGNFELLSEKCYKPICT